MNRGGAESTHSWWSPWRGSWRALPLGTCWGNSVLTWAMIVRPERSKPGFSDLISLSQIVHSKHCAQAKGCSYMHVRAQFDDWHCGRAIRHVLDTTVKKGVEVILRSSVIMAVLVSSTSSKQVTLITPLSFEKRGTKNYAHPSQVRTFIQKPWMVNSKPDLSKGVHLKQNLFNEGYMSNLRNKY